MFKRNLRNKKVYGMRAKTYISVWILVVAILATSVIGIHFRNQEKLTARYFNQSKAYAQEIKKLTTYQKPTLSSQTEQERAIYIIKKVWKDKWETGVLLATCESGLREKVVNSIGATGYFQINTSAHKVSIEDMQSGWGNAGYAYSLFLEQGFGPWLASNSCHHLIK